MFIVLQEYEETEEVECLDEDVAIVSEALNQECTTFTSSASTTSSAHSPVMNQPSGTKRCHDDVEKSPIPKKKGLSSSARLDKSLLIGSAMSEISSRDSTIRERYYNRKITLLQKQTEILEKQADALVQIAAFVTKTEGI